MLVDLHNHTKLCNHANGEIEEYIEKAIENKTLHFGFADHAPMNFDKKYRMDITQTNLYENRILKAKERYKDKIKIYLGYEVDFLEGLMEERILNAKVDFLIGSVHFLKRWGFDNPEFIGEYKNKDIDKLWQEYFDAIEMMAKSSLFDIVGHIDLIKIFGFLPKKDIRLIAKKALLAIKKADLVIELNSAGYRKPTGEAYPSNAILELMCEIDIPITFGSDAHKANQVGYKSDELEKLARSFGYTKCAIFKNRDRKMINF